MKILFILFIVIFCEHCYSQKTPCESTKTENLLCSDKGSIYYRYYKVPKTIKKFLNEKSGERLAFSSQKTNYKRRLHNRVLLFIVNIDNEWIMYYGHGTRGIHRHILHLKLSEQNEICYFVNYLYFGNENSLDTLKDSACNNKLTFNKVDSEKDL